MSRNIGIEPDALRDLIDLATIADTVGMVARCPGGRWIVKGYVCHICGEDPSVVHERDGKKFKRCGSAKRKNVKRATLVEDLRSAFPVEM